MANAFWLFRERFLFDALHVWTWKTPLAFQATEQNEEADPAVVVWLDAILS